MKTLEKTNLPANLHGRGKVRDSYESRDNTLVIVTTDRISCYDVILGQQIPYKGQGLNASSIFSFEDTASIVPNHYIESPHPNVMVVKRAEPYPVEVIVRGYLSGSAWRNYEKGQRVFFDAELPDGLRRNQNLMQEIGNPIVTPSTKAELGQHDVDLSAENIGDYVPAKQWAEMREIAVDLFKRANILAAKNGYVMADTKYEFGLIDRRLHLIDEANTHDSSRFFLRDSYGERFESGRDPNWIDKEYVRSYLKSVGFTGEGMPPDLPAEIIKGASERVMESVFALTGQHFSSVEPKEEEIIEALRKNRWI